MFWFVLGALLLFVAGISTIFSFDKKFQKMPFSEKILQFFVIIAIFFCLAFITSAAGLFIIGSAFSPCTSHLGNF
jgi:bacteriorhodopsin